MSERRLNRVRATSESVSDGRAETRLHVSCLPFCSSLLLPNCLDCSPLVKGETCAI